MRSSKGREKNGKGVGGGEESGEEELVEQDEEDRDRVFDGEVDVVVDDGSGGVMFEGRANNGIVMLLVMRFLASRFFFFLGLGYRHRFFFPC